MVTVLVLDCRIRKILLADSVWRAQTHHCTKFRQSRRSIADILRFSNFQKWPPPPSWIVEIAKFYWLFGWRRWRRISMPNFVKIGQSVVKVLRFFDFLKMAAVRHHGFVWGIFGPPTVSSCGSLSLQNLVMIDAVVFIICTFQYLTCFALKCLFTLKKLGFWGNLIP